MINNMTNQIAENKKLMNNILQIYLNTNNKQNIVCEIKIKAKKKPRKKKNKT